MYIPPFVYPFVNGHLDYFRQKDMNNAIANNAAMKTGIQIYV